MSKVGLNTIKNYASIGGVVVMDLISRLVQVAFLFLLASFLIRCGEIIGGY